MYPDFLSKNPRFFYKHFQKIIFLGKSILKFLDGIFGDTVSSTFREIAAFVIDGVIVGVLAFYPHLKANPAIIEKNIDQLWQKEDKEVSVKLCIDRLWVAPKYRRKGNFLY